MDGVRLSKAVIRFAESDRGGSWEIDPRQEGWKAVCRRSNQLWKERAGAFPLSASADETIPFGENFLPKEPEEKPSAKRPPRNRLRPGAKYDEAAFVRMAYCFCNGVPVAIAARSVGLSQKTVRGVYLDLRARLLDPAFNRWHGTNRRFPNLPGPEYEVMLRAGYFDRLARCALDETCARNWRLGNRKRRQCRSCPLAETFSDERRAEAYTVIDAVHLFYEQLGIRGETAASPVLLFRERLIHTTVIATVQNQSRKLPTGLLDMNDKSFLSVSSLLKVLSLLDSEEH